METQWKSSVCFVRFCVVLILALQSMDVESRLKEQEPVLGYLLESGTINQEMAELLRGDCSPEFVNSKQALQEIEVQFMEQRLRDTTEFSNSVSYDSKVYNDAVDMLHSQINNILVDCVRRKKLMLDSGEDESLNTWYARYLWFLFNRSQLSTRRALAETPGEAPAPSLTALPPGPAPSVPLTSTEHPSSPPLPFFPKNSNVQSVDSNAQSSHHKTSKRTVVTAVVVTASVTLLIAALLFLCWHSCGDRFRRGRNDERPLLSLSLNDYSIASTFGHGAMGTEEKISNESVDNKLNHSKVHGSFYMESQSLSSSKAEIPPPNKVEGSSQMPPGMWSAPGLPPLKPTPGRMGALKPPPGRSYPSKPPPRRTDPPKPPPCIVNSSKLPLLPPSPAPELSSFPPTNPFSDAPHAPSPPHLRACPPPPQPPPPPKAGPHPPPPPPRTGPPPPQPPPPRAGPPPPQPPPPRAGPPPPQPPPLGVKPPRPSPLGIRPNSTSTSDEESEAASSKAKLKPFFWDKVLANPDHSMVWHQIKSGSFQFNEEMIETLFGYVPPAKNKTEEKKESSPQDAQPQYIQLIDPKKSQNIAILLKALNVTTEEVCDALVEGNELPPELVQTLLKMAPTSDEELKLRVYTDQLSLLGPAERFLKVLVGIPFAFKRLDSLLFMCTLQEETSILKESFAVLEAACTELRKSRLFLKLLEAVLKTGNRMNDGTFRGGAQAFKLDTLLKLSDVKGTDGKTTLLHFVVQEITRSEGKRAAQMEKEAKSLPDLDTDSDERLQHTGLKVVSGLGDELENVKKAAILDADSIRGMVSKLRQELKKVQDFLNSDMKNSGKEDGFHQALRNFVQNAEIDVAWAVEEEKRIMALVKNTADYFHGNSGKDEGLRLFTIVRDFLIILDKVCKEVKSNPIKPKRKEGATVSTTFPDLRQNAAAPVDLRERLFPAIAGRRIDSSSSDDESEG